MGPDLPSDLRTPANQRTGEPVYNRARLRHCFVVVCCGSRKAPTTHLFIFYSYQLPAYQPISLPAYQLPATRVPGSHILCLIFPNNTTLSTYVRHHH